MFLTLTSQNNPQTPQISPFLRINDKYPPIFLKIFKKFFIIHFSYLLLTSWLNYVNSVYIFLASLSVTQTKYVKIRVNRLRLFSKVVSAKIFPSVLMPKRKRKAHNRIFTTFIGMKQDKYLPLRSSKTTRKRLIRIDIISNTYISILFSILPPQVML